MTTYTITCDGPGPHDPPSGIIGTTDTPPKPGQRCGAAVCVPPVPAPLVAAAAQDTAVHQLLTGAQALLGRLGTYHADLVTKATAQAAAKAALAAKIGALPAAPTAAQTGTFIKTDLAAYLTATDASVMAVGTDLDQTITGLGSVVKALGNLIARQTGDPTTL